MKHTYKVKYIACEMAKICHSSIKKDDFFGRKLNFARQFHLQPTFNFEVLVLGDAIRLFGDLGGAGKLRFCSIDFIYGCV